MFFFFRCDFKHPIGDHQIDSYNFCAFLIWKCVISLILGVHRICRLAGKLQDLESPANCCISGGWNCYKVLPCILLMKMQIVGNYRRAESTVLFATRLTEYKNTMWITNLPTKNRNHLAFFIIRFKILKSTVSNKNQLTTNNHHF